MYDLGEDGKGMSRVAAISQQTTVQNAAIVAKYALTTIRHYTHTSLCLKSCVISMALRVGTVVCVCVCVCVWRRLMMLLCECFRCDRSHFKPLVHIAAIPRTESTNIHLVAITHTGLCVHISNMYRVPDSTRI